MATADIRATIKTVIIAPSPWPRTREWQQNAQHYDTNARISDHLPSDMANMIIEYVQSPLPYLNEVHNRFRHHTYTHLCVMQQVPTADDKACTLQVMQVRIELVKPKGWIELPVMHSGYLRPISTLMKDVKYNRHNDMFSRRWNGRTDPHPADIGDGNGNIEPYYTPRRTALMVPFTAHSRWNKPL